MVGRHPRPGASGHSSSGTTSAEATQYRDSGAEPVARRVSRLLQAQEVPPRVITLVCDTYGPDALSEAWGEFRCCDTDDDRGTLLELTEESPFIEQFTSWLAHNWTPMMLSEKPENVAVSAQVPARTFLARHPDLDPLIARYMNACIDTPFSFFEILSSEPGKRFTCRDLICGGEQLVLESAASQDLPACQILYARIVKLDGIPLMDAAAPWPLPAEDLKPAILALRKAILDVEPAYPRQRLLAHDSDVRSFYWGFIEQAILGETVRLQGFDRKNGQH